MTSRDAIPELNGGVVDATLMPLLAEALAAEGLPVEDLDGEGRNFFAFRDRAGALVGFAGMEIFGGDALLRSLIVLPPVRERTYGTAIAEWMMAEAARRGVRMLFLLTTTAAPFFAKLGFHRIDRKAVPAAIAATREFAALCPTTAVCMMKALVPPAQS
ncbi:MAG TPA: arsenic resistance N-acetyltransferase ArsN2 [Stellaceae bacterium]